MRCKPDIRGTEPGYCLAELLFVVSVLGIALGVGTSCVLAGLQRVEARGAAECVQIAVAWGQTGAAWFGGQVQVSDVGGTMAVVHDSNLCGGVLEASAPQVALNSNISRWNTVGGVAVDFKGAFASPNSGGSVYAPSADGSFRVVIRPESGLTVRTWVSE